MNYSGTCYVPKDCVQCKKSIPFPELQTDIHGLDVHVGGYGMRGTCSPNPTLHERCIGCHHMYAPEKDGSPREGICSLCYENRLVVCGGRCDEEINIYASDDDGYEDSVKCWACNDVFHYECTRFSENAFGHVICQSCLLNKNSANKCNHCELSGGDNIHTQLMVMCIKCEAVPLHPQCAIQGCCSACSLLK